MNKITTLGFLALLPGLISDSAAATFPEGWDEPAAGYAVVYDASNGVWPHDAAPWWDIDPFRGDRYTSETSFVTTDSITGEPALLMREMDENGWPSYSLAHSGGAGTAEDKMTIDFRFRLPRLEGIDSDAENPSSFRVNIWRPSNDGASSVRYAITFSPAGVDFVAGDEAPYPFGTDWHNVRLTIDASQEVCSVYVNGEREPLFVEKGTPNQPGDRNMVLFGQQGPGVYGDVKLAYFKFTNEEIATEPEFPVNLPNLSIGEAAEIGFPTDSGRYYQVEKSVDGDGQWLSHTAFLGTGESWSELISLREEPAIYRVFSSGDVDWPAPDGDFTVSYEAVGGIWPYDVPPPWGWSPFAAYPETNAYITTDDLTGEPVLYMNSVGAGTASPSFTQDEAGGVGTAADRMTVDFRFRLVGDVSGSLAQFRVGVWRPDSSGTSSIRYMVDFLPDNVSFTGGPTLNYPFGTEWHNARVTIDLVEEVGKLFLNGSSVPVLEFHGGTPGQAASRNFVMFGHPAAAANGAVNLAYFRFTNDGVSEPDPEWIEQDLEWRNNAIELTMRLRAGSEYAIQSTAAFDAWDVADSFFATNRVLHTLIRIPEDDPRRFFRLIEDSD